MTQKIIGIRKAVSAIKNAPDGWHVEIWSERDGDTIRVWPSELLTSNSWTVYHDDNVRAVEYYEALDAAEYRCQSISLTEAIRRQIASMYPEAA